MKDSQRPLVSILMPVYNAEPFLEETLRSILDQTLSDWELITVDDHSTDESRRILNRYAKLDPRITVNTNKGNGIIEALRQGFHESCGQLITRMDADDIMSPNKLRSLSGELLATGSGHVATSCVRYFSDDGLGEGYLRYAEWLNDLTKTERNFSEIYRECPIPSPNWMMHREDLIRIGGFDPNEYPEDYDLAFRMYQANMSIKGLTDVLHNWRDHSDRTSRNDERYEDNSFIPLKVNWFLKIDRDAKKELLLWGAGNRGKKIADQLIRKKVSFRWFSNNPKKIGKEIYDVRIEPSSSITMNSPAQLLDSIADRTARKEKHEMKLRFAEAYFAFC